EEDFDQAKKLKEMIVSLRSVGSRLARLEAEKVAAVELEDYDKAKRIKAEMDRIRLEHAQSKFQQLSIPVRAASPGNEFRAVSPVKHATLNNAPQSQPGHSVIQVCYKGRFQRCIVEMQPRIRRKRAPIIFRMTTVHYQP
ncbi:hypothetical protein BVRB_021150, partial [Beta vulgaris subsp. vulgaris]